MRSVAARLAALPALLLATSLMGFALLDLAPGDFLTRLSSDPLINADTLGQLRLQYGLDEPLLWRYGRWLAGAARGDLGYSLCHHAPVAGLIAGRLANTLLLTGSALLLSWLLALPLGAISAATEGRWPDRLIGAVSFFLLSCPRIVLALLAVMLAGATGWFPTSGMVDPLSWSTGGARIGEVAWHLCLPAAVVALPQAATYTRHVRGQISHALAMDCVQVAWAKGLTPRQVIWRHALPPASAPLITLFGQGIGGLLAGSFLVEIIFGWPGMARLTLEAVMAQDEQLAVALIAVTTATLVLGNLLADLWLLRVDPRLRR